jgi:hypothetical protein
MNKILEALKETGEKIDRMTQAEVQELLDSAEYGPIALGMDEELIERALEYKAGAYRIYSSFVMDRKYENARLPEISNLAHSIRANYFQVVDCANDPIYWRSTEFESDSDDSYSLAA